MRHKLIFLFFSSLFFGRTAGNTNGSEIRALQAGGVKKLYEVTVANNALTKGLDVLICDVFNDTLYFINNSKLVKMSLKSGKLSTDAPLNFFLMHKHRLHRDATRLSVAGNGYVINLGTELDFLLPNGKEDVIYGGLATDDVPVGKNILLALPKGVELMSMDGKKLDNIAINLGSIGFFHTSHGFGNADDPDHVEEFTVDNTNHIKKSFYPSTDAFKAISNSLYAGYADDQYFFLYDDASRDNIFAVKKGEKKVYKIIPLGQSCNPSGEEIQDEEGGDPNFRVIPHNGGYYIIALAKKKLVVLQFEM